MNTITPVTDRIYTSIKTADIVDNITNTLHNAYCGSKCGDDCGFMEEQDFLLNEVLNGRIVYVAGHYFGGDAILFDDIQGLVGDLNALTVHEEVNS